MAMNSDPSNVQAAQRCAKIRAHVHAAFDEVALSYSCTLPRLLAATRSLGINDEDVRTILTMEEAEEQDGVESDMHLRCDRSNCGVLHFTRDTAASNERAPSFEAFAELWRTDRR